MSESAYNDNVAGNEPCAASCCVSLSGSMGNRVLASAEARAWQLQTLGAVLYSGLYCMDYTGVWYRLSPDFGKNILHSVLENAKDGDLLALYGSSHGIGLYIWMYGTYILVCKEVVLLVGLLSELLLMRIPLRYRSGKNAVTFVSFYYLFCQNAVFRGTFLMEAALVIPLCGVMLREAASPFSDNASIMLYAAFCC